MLTGFWYQRHFDIDALAKLGLGENNMNEIFLDNYICWIDIIAYDLW